MSDGTLAGAGAAGDRADGDSRWAEAGVQASSQYQAAEKAIRVLGADTWLRLENLMWWIVNGGKACQNN